MSQGRTKGLREEAGQLKLEEFIVNANPQTPKNQRETNKPRKRKTPPSLEKENQPKKYNLEHEVTDHPILEETIKMSSTDPTVYELKTDDPIITAMERLLEPMWTDICDILKSQKDMKVDFLLIDKLKEENVTLTKRVEKVETINETLTKQICALEDRILQNNVIIHGIPESPWETDDVRQEKLYYAFSETVLGTSIDQRMDTARSMHIAGSRRIGRFRQMSARPISVEMQYKSDADYLIANRRYFSKGIFIDREYSKETESARKILRPYLKAARKLPKYQRKCRLDGGTLILKGLSYTVDTLHKLPEELHAFNISSSSNDTVFGFFGSMNPLSNFYPIQYDHKGKSFHSSEQYIQYTKAMFFGDEQCAKHIMSTDTALESKAVSRNITGFDYTKWEEVAKQQCKEGICAKFMSDKTLQNTLLGTSDKTIVECCRDKVWGTGIPLHEESCLDPRNWGSQGILGEILQELRTELKLLTSDNSEEDCESQVNQDPPGNPPDQTMDTG